jgi:hypothetical protein
VNGKQLTENNSKAPITFAEYSINDKNKNVILLTSEQQTESVISEGKNLII